MIDYKLFSLSSALQVLGEETVQEKLNGFSCQAEEDLEDFLANKAIKYEGNGSAKTFLIVKSGDSDFEIVAYFALANTAIELSNFSDNRKKKIMGDFPNRARRNTFPAFLIGQLGRDDKYSHDDISGETLLLEAFSTLKQASSIVGGKLVVLECREHMFSKVYEKLGFKKLVDELNENNLYMLYRRVDFANLLTDD